jgi:hypothetical protein
MTTMLKGLQAAKIAAKIDREFRIEGEAHYQLQPFFLDLRNLRNRWICVALLSQANLAGVGLA